MPKAPSPPPPINPTTTAQTGVGFNAQTGVMGQQGSAVDQNNPYGNLSYTTSINPTTGLPELTANTSYSPEQQAIFALMQGGQIGTGAANLGNIAANFGQYAQDPTQLLMGQTGSLTNNWLDAQNPAWERFMAPQRDQLRTQLINQGLTEGSPAYQQQMDMLTQQQLLTKGSALASFQPQAFQEAQTGLQDPLAFAQQMFGMSQPGQLPGQIINTPGLNVNPVDYGQLATTSQQEAFQNYQQKVAAQNASMKMGVDSIGNIMKLPTGGGSSFGGDLASGAMMAMML